MSSRLFQSESKFIERCRTALVNAQSDSVIKAALADYGMSDEQLNEGQQLFARVQAVWNANTADEAETTQASNLYKATYNQLQSVFKIHRDKSLIYFKKEPDVLVKLGV